MQKIKFFTGDPSEISHEFEVWQVETPGFRILDKAIAMELLVLPVPPNPNALLSAGATPPMQGQVLTVLYLMVTYEDLPDNPT